MLEWVKNLSSMRACPRLRKRLRACLIETAVIHNGLRVHIFTDCYYIATCSLIIHYTRCNENTHTHKHMHARIYTCMHVSASTLTNLVYELTHNFCPNSFIFQLLPGHVQDTHRTRPHHITISHTETRTSQ